MAKKKNPNHKTWRPTFEDVKLLSELKAKTGIMSETDIIRLAIRALAAKEGLSA